MSPVGLAEQLANLPGGEDPNLLVGFTGGDDAAVYRLRDDLALVLTADLITPPVDDPAVFGRIAAANALSDVYAMGGQPLACLNLVAFPEGKLGQDVLAEILRGAAETVVQAGAVVAGGHTVIDDEPKFGLSVTGTVHPDRYWANAGARDGDALVLTKPLGSGVLFNGNLKGRVSASAMRTCIDALVTLNDTAARIAAHFEVHAATDVTGFGLAGHAMEMAVGSDVLLRLHLDALPIYPEVVSLYRKGVGTQGNKGNRAMVADHLWVSGRATGVEGEVLFDPQTSGGLLLAVPAEEGEPLVAELRDAGVEAACVIGEAVTADRVGVEVS